MIRPLTAGLVLLVCPAWMTMVHGQTRTNFHRGHAHNDYLHENPLIDAFANGFRSVEADIYLVDGKLLVAHDLDKTSPDRTLQKLYLDPLATRIRKRGNTFETTNGPITLLIDIKSDGAETFHALNKVLMNYRDILSHTDADGFHSGPVSAIVSGNRAWNVIRNASPRMAGVDGRLSNLQSNESAELMPLISDHWGRHFQWRGVGPMPQADQEQLEKIVSQAHARGRRVRFWATPDKKAVWRALEMADVDLINTDDLEGLNQFLNTDTSTAR